MPATRITNWSVVQLPPPPRVAVRLTDRKRIANGIGEDKPLPGPVRLDDSLVFDLRSAEASGKCSFDADRFLVDVPGGQLEIRQLGETLDDGLATPERAQLYFAARADTRASSARVSSPCKRTASMITRRLCTRACSRFVPDVFIVSLPGWTGEILAGITDLTTTRAGGSSRWHTLCYA